MRRRIGPAYEQSPAEKLGKGFSANLLRLSVAAAVIVVYCLAVNWVVDGLLNFIASDGIHEGPARFSSDDPTVLMVKIVGSVILVILFCKGPSK